MNLNSLTKIKQKRQKRVGRGLGSGLGKTAGRGTKGQKARGKIPASFIGGTLPLYKKLPYKRGYHRDGIHSSNATPKKMKVLNLEDLKNFSLKSVVNIQTLQESGLIKEKDVKAGVKILGAGKVISGLVVQVPVSASARKSIEQAGGKIDGV